MATYRYHWTHSNNLESIAAEGLDPNRSQGVLPLVWCVESWQIAWGRAHIAARHGWAIDDLVLLRLDMDGIPTRERTLRGVHNTPLAVSPRRIRVILGAWAGRPRAVTLSDAIGE